MQLGAATNAQPPRQAFNSRLPAAAAAPAVPGSRLASKLNARNSDGSDLDPVERFVGWVFGRAALDDPAPGGLRRLSEEARRELYPATTDTWAAAVDGDDPYVAAVVRPLLAQTQLETAPLRLAYDAASQGWSPAAFHAAVDTFGAAVVVAETEHGEICGGYNPRGWTSLGEQSRDSVAAFLYTWPSRPDGHATARPVKLPHVGGGALAVVNDAEGYGIHFGPDGLSIPLTPGAKRAARCKLGPCYARQPDGSKSLWGGGQRTELAGLRVYVAAGGGEQWELDGIVWRTKRV